jgi:hypothetical protein
MQKTEKIDSQYSSNTSIKEHIHCNDSHCCLLCSTDFKDWEWTEFILDYVHLQSLLAVLSLLNTIIRELHSLFYEKNKTEQRGLKK